MAARNPATRWYAALAVLLVFVLLAWLLGAVLTLTDGERVALRVGLVVLGLVGAAALLWYLRPRDEPIPVADASKRDEALAAVAAARATLPRGAFASKAIVLVMGSERSSKTTIVARSGLDPQLLAGDAPGAADDAPSPTTAANLWLVGETVLAEAANAVFADSGRWRSFVRALRPGQFGAAFGRGQAPSRAAVVCVASDFFYSGDAGAQLDTLATLTRERLAEAGRELGVALPVYVVFTRADRIQHFEAWASTFTRDEVRIPLGAALPFDVVPTSGRDRAAAAGSYAERAEARLHAAFARMISALAGGRLELLGRETVLERRLTAYELPRELGKLQPLATRFLVELCRPMQIGVSPQLRGFYFVGARPVVVTSAAADQPVVQARARPNMAPGATAVFSAGSLPESSPRPVAAAPVTRRVPQWVFLDRLFPDVILADASAAAMSRGGVRVSRLRRAVIGVGIAATVVIAVGVIVSALSNRSLAARVTNASRAVASLPVVDSPSGALTFASPEALRTLDSLRGVLETLRGYSRNGVPTHLRWGLWTGDDLLTSGRRVWMEGYRRQLYAAASGTLIDSLRALPDAPRPGEYGRDYGMLKAYLIMTKEPRRSTAAFLAPVLLDSWVRGATIDADVMALARRQFEFYSAELAYDNPWPQAADEALVARGRDLLGRFAGTEQIYQYMVQAADSVVPAQKLVAVAPQSAGVVSAPDMPGAFTVAGWQQMEKGFANPGKFLQGESWVVGDAGAARVQDSTKIVADLRTLYRRDYVQRWRTFVQTTAVLRPTSTRDAAQKLAVIGGAQSPVLAALAMVAQNTAVDSSIAAAFQPVTAVTPAGPANKYLSDANQPYLAAILALQMAVDGVANMPPPADSGGAAAVAQAAQQARAGAVAQAKLAARKLEQSFAVDTASNRVSPAVSALLEAPLNGADGVLVAAAQTRAPVGRRQAAAPSPSPTVSPAPAPASGPPPTPTPSGKDPAAIAAVLNQWGRSLCDAVTPMLDQFPFNPGGAVDARISSVATVLAPTTGTLWEFQAQHLVGILEKQGGQWVQKADAPVQLSASFITFFNRAAAISAALFANGTPEPQIGLTARGLATDKARHITLNYGSQVARFDKNTLPAQLLWPPPAGRDVRLSATINKKEVAIAQGTGDWALFRMVAQAARADDNGSGVVHAEWNTNNKDAPTVSMEFKMTNGAAVLARGWLSRMACVSQVTR